MSGLINKVKDALHSDKHDTTTHSSTTGHSTTGHSSTGTGLTGTHGGSTNAGPHDSNALNKADPRVDSDLDGGRHAGLNQTTTGGGYSSGTGNLTGTHGSTNAGPHDSNLLNKADPRVDSDLSGSRNTGTHSSGLTGGTTGHNTHSGTGLTGGSHGTGSGLTGSSGQTAGPHSSGLANKLDPRVDSDLDGSRNAGAASNTHHTGGVGSGYGSSNTTAGPHSSNLANKADPRVDSDLDGRGTHSGGLTGSHGTTGTHSGGLTGSHGTTGTHSGGLTGSSNTTGTSGYGSTGHTGGVTGSHGTHGSSTNTAGPHSSDMLNKLDPRVDSDLDGSKTVGGNKTLG